MKDLRAWKRLIFMFRHIFFAKNTDCRSTLFFEFDLFSYYSSGRSKLQLYESHRRMCLDIVSQFRFRESIISLTVQAFRLTISGLSLWTPGILLSANWFFYTNLPDSLFQSFISPPQEIKILIIILSGETRILNIIISSLSHHFVEKYWFFLCKNVVYY